MPTSPIDTHVSLIGDDNAGTNTAVPDVKRRHIFMRGVFAGGVYGGVECLLLYPSIYLKTQLQIEHGRNLPGYKMAKFLLQSIHADHILRKYEGPIDCIRKTYQTSGIRGFYTGCLVTVMGHIPKGAVRYGTMEAMSQHFERYRNVGLPQKLLAGGVAAVLETYLVGAPLDTITTRVIQLKQYDSHKLAGVLSLSRTIYARDGVAGFYQGTSSLLVRQVSMQSIRLCVFEVCRKAYKAGNADAPVPLWVTACSGGLAGVISVTCTMPVDVVKTRMQGLFGSRYKNSWQCCEDIYRKEGASAFYRGIGPRMVRSCIDMAFIFFLYEYIFYDLKRVL